MSTGFVGGELRGCSGGWWGGKAELEMLEAEESQSDSSSLLL